MARLRLVPRGRDVGLAIPISMLLHGAVVAAIALGWQLGAGAPHEVPMDVVVIMEPAMAEEAPEAQAARAPEMSEQLPPVEPLRPVQMAEKGTVVVRALVDANGNPAGIAIWESSGFPMLDRAAERAVGKWRFRPATLNARPTQAGSRSPCISICAETA